MRSESDRSHRYAETVRPDGPGHWFGYNHFGGNHDTVFGVLL